MRTLTRIAAALVLCVGALPAEDAVTTTLREGDAEFGWFKSNANVDVPAEGPIPIHLDNGRSAQWLLLFDPDANKVIFEEAHGTGFLQGNGTALYDEKVVSLRDGQTLLELPGERWGRCQTPDGKRFYVVSPSAGAKVEAYDAAAGKVLFRKTLRQGPRCTAFGLLVLPKGKGVLATGYGTLEHHKALSALSLEVFNAKGKTTAYLDLTPQAKASASPLQRAIETVKGKATAGYLVPDVQNKKGQRGLLFQSAKGKRVIFVPGGRDLLSFGDLDTVERDGVPYALVSCGTQEQPDSKVRLWNTKKNRLLKGELPGPLSVHGSGYGLYKSELWDLVETKKLKDLPPATVLAYGSTNVVSWSEANGLSFQPLGGGDATGVELPGSGVSLLATRLPSRWLGVKVSRADGDWFGYLDEEKKSVSLVKHYPKPDTGKLIGVGYLRGKIHVLVQVMVHDLGRHRIDLIRVTPK